MDNLAAVHEALSRILDAIGFDGDGPLSFGEPLISAEWRRTRRALGQNCPEAVRSSADALDETIERWAAGDLDAGADPSMFLSRLEVFVNAVESCLHALPVVRMWELSSQLQAVEHAITRFFERKSHTEAKSFSRVLADSAWARSVVEELARYHDSQSHQSRIESAPSFGGAGYWVEVLERDPSARLASLLRAVRYPLEARARSAWIEKAGPEPALHNLYRKAWGEMFSAEPDGISRNTLKRILDEACNLCSFLKIDEMAHFASDHDFLISYGLQWLVPPNPADWVIRSAADFRSVLAGQLSRWYYRPFRYALSAPEMVAGVLSAGRPLFYERIAVHAIVQYGVIQSLPPSEGLNDIYFELQNCLLDDFETLLDGFLLRKSFRNQVNTPSAWQGYLESLVALHFDKRPGPPPALSRQFLAERGLRSGREVLLEMGRRITTVH